MPSITSQYTFSYKTSWVWYQIYLMLYYVEARNNLNLLVQEFLRHWYIISNNALKKPSSGLWSCLDDSVQGWEATLKWSIVEMTLVWTDDKSVYIRYDIKIIHTDIKMIHHLSYLKVLISLSLEDRIRRILTSDRK